MRKLYHRADPTVIDPTYDLILPSRSTLTVRPLTDDELDVLRAVSLSTLIETRQPAIVALAEAGAVTTEIAAVTRTNLNLDAGTVALPGARHAVARNVPLTEWGAAQLARRARCTDGALTYNGSGVGNAAQASVSVALRRMFHTAGFGAEHDLALSSVRGWAGRRAFDASGRIDDATRVLGCLRLGRRRSGRCGVAARPDRRWAPTGLSDGVRVDLERAGHRVRIVPPG